MRRRRPGPVRGAAADARPADREARPAGAPPFRPAMAGLRRYMQGLEARKLPAALSDLEGKVASIVTGIVMVDVIAFAKRPSREQLSIVLAGQDTVRRELIPSLAARTGREVGELILGLVPTGDGFYVLLHPSIAAWAPLFAVHFRNAAATVSTSSMVAPGSPVLIRAAAHLGEVFPFEDLSGNPNFVGDGMNDCARLLSCPARIQERCERHAGAKDWVICSAAAFDAFRETVRGHQAWANGLGLRTTEELRFRDKHRREHVCRGVEASRDATLTPPRREPGAGPVATGS